MTSGKYSNHPHISTKTNKNSANISSKSIVYLRIIYKLLNMAILGQTTPMFWYWILLLHMLYCCSHHCFFFIDFSIRCLIERSSFNSNIACLASIPNLRNRKTLFKNIHTRAYNWYTQVPITHSFWIRGWFIQQHANRFFHHCFGFV